MQLCVVGTCHDDTVVVIAHTVIGIVVRLAHAYGMAVGALRVELCKPLALLILLQPVGQLNFKLHAHDVGGIFQFYGQAQRFAGGICHLRHAQDVRLGNGARHHQPAQENCGNIFCRLHGSYLLILNCPSFVFTIYTLGICPVASSLTLRPWRS